MPVYEITHPDGTLERVEGDALRQEAAHAPGIQPAILTQWTIRHRPTSASVDAEHHDPQNLFHLNQNIAP